MQTPHNRREKTPRRITWDFLENPRFELSPIPEAGRSSPDSSLPDLIVEAEPNRHDDPPSFYVGLERRIKRYYRQLFHPDMYDSENSDFEVNGETEQTSPVRAFKTKKSADRLENISSDSTEINASIEGEKEKSVEHNVQNLKDYARKFDEFWSVSPVKVNLEDLPKDSNAHKRRSDSRDDAPSRKKKKDADTETTFQEC